ncbi:TetR/AcrR family transcriptional regulator [Thalassobaculum litoreum]|uniref:Transcriptional regulator, TetR family n=1 Tax=Thalassobaculum litoreum DSM 18839 TaxID=1123362 RepID=A0A8G2BEB3_9PROT|nr:TetR/AcrR family transcriptional regulator [Thalassobaculum litoreum]SDF04345.1 transcriptional regulator, TetR family [Thalassobaculum litoreum DSM 18839]
MPRPAAPREEIVDRLGDVFRRHGYGGASLKLLSDATGLGRSSLYHYFPNGKEDMALAVLDSAERWMGDEVVPILESAASPQEKVRAVVAALDRFYLGGRRSCLLELFAIGDAREVFGPRVSQRLANLRSALAGIAREAGHPPDDATRRAEDAMIAIHGGLVVSRGLGDTTPFRRVLDGLEKTLIG